MTDALPTEAIDRTRVHDIFTNLKREIKKVIVGQDKVIDLILGALLIRGHVLLEGVPGTAKTLTIKTLAHCIGVTFRRIQISTCG